MNGTFRRQAAVASAVLVLGAVGSVFLGGTAFADDSHDHQGRDGGVASPRGTAHATCVGPPLSVGVAVVGQNSGDTTQCSVKKGSVKKGSVKKDPPPAHDDGGDGS